MATWFTTLRIFCQIPFRLPCSLWRRYNCLAKFVVGIFISNSTAPCATASTTPTAEIARFAGRLRQITGTPLLVKVDSFVCLLLLLCLWWWYLLLWANWLFGTLYTINWFDFLGDRFQSLFVYLEQSRLILILRRTFFLTIRMQQLLRLLHLRLCLA